MTFEEFLQNELEELRHWSNDPELQFEPSYISRMRRAYNAATSSESKITRRKMMFKNAKVGDKVWDICRGWGEIISITRTNTYPVEVRFPDATAPTYTFEGRRIHTDINPTIYWDELTIVPPKKRLPNLAVDTKVLVWDDGDDFKMRAHFHSFDKDGRIATWPNGRTSFTEQGSPTFLWDNWELYKE